MRTAAQVRDYAAKYGFRRPDWMSDWQWQRVQELKAIGRVQEYPAALEDYARWVDSMLAKPPRTWDGFQAAEMTQSYCLFGETWPAPVRCTPNTPRSSPQAPKRCDCSRNPG